MEITDRVETSSPKRELTSSSPLMASKVSGAQAQAHPKKSELRSSSRKLKLIFRIFLKQNNTYAKQCIFASQMQT